MASRRTQALGLMEKITQQALEQEAAALGALYRKIDALAAEKAELLATLQEQSESRSLETAPYLPGFLRAVRTEEARIDADILDLEGRITELEAALRERFREKKTFEKVLADARHRDRDEARRAEERVMDEFNSTRRGRAQARTAGIS